MTDRKSMNQYFNDKMKEIDTLGNIQQDPKKPMTAFDMKAADKIRSLQKEMRKVIQLSEC